jgi:hypothetical protein
LIHEKLFQQHEKEHHRLQLHRGGIPPYQFEEGGEGVGHGNLPRNFQLQCRKWERKSRAWISAMTSG